MRTWPLVPSGLPAPAMAAGVTDKLWELSDLVAMIDEYAPKPGKRGPYKKGASM